MFELTPAERRGALVVVGLLALGAGWDLVRARWPRLDPLPPPSVAEGGPAGATRAPDPPAGAAGEGRPAPVDLNRATVEQLDDLPGIGPVLARRIVEHRAVHGPFTRPEDLLAVRGIGPRSFARLRPWVTAGAASAPPAAPAVTPRAGPAALQPAR